jgi:2-keto-4-pentenoate hydratase/2-oxohepta-3-ene-1,7-dioic acid hydratase in catechol pathway
MAEGVYRLGVARTPDGEQVLVAADAGVFVLSDLLADAPHDVVTLLADWPRWASELTQALARTTAMPRSVEEIDFLAPIVRPPKLICIGTNYHDHLAEMGVTTTPQFPYAFLRPLTCLNGHRQPVTLPSWPAQIDWEAELGVVLARGGRDLVGVEAMAAVGGYTVINDLSARDWIEDRPWVGIDWVMQKAWDGFQPTGPWVTPAAYVPECQALDISLTVNGVVRQASNTGQMIFGVGAIIEHLSRIMTLEPGDVIATGTPAGVGFGQRPRLSLAAGDVVRVEIAGLGGLENTMV